MEMGERAGRTVGAPAVRRYTANHVVTGILLLLYGLVALGWIVFALWMTRYNVGGLLAAVAGFDSLERPWQLLSPAEWAYVAALMVVGVIALCRRRVARGACLLMAVFVLYASGRELVGYALSAEYRSVANGGLLPWVVAIRVLGLVFGVVVIAVMLPARQERRVRHASRPVMLAGALLLGTGILAAAWYLIGLVLDVRRSGEAPDMKLDLRSSLLNLVDAAAQGDQGRNMGTNAALAFVFAAASIVVGALLLVRRNAAKGAALVVAGVGSYLAYRGVVAPLLGQVMPGGTSASGLWTLTALVDFGASIALLLGRGAVFVLVLLSTRRTPAGPAFGATPAVTPFGVRGFSENFRT